jgi:uncharacterized protein
VRLYPDTMRSAFLTVIFLAACLQAPVACAAGTGQYPPHVITNSELRTLPATADGRRYQLHVHLPASFGKQPKRRYPVLYLTDAYWDFANVVSTYTSLVEDKVLPEVIVVGLGYAGKNPDHEKLRLWELSPVDLGPNEPSSGHADKFLATLERQIFPFVEREYRADPARRMLAGSSLGGLFTLYAMYSRPELFQGYISVSPALGIGKEWLMGQAREFAKSNKAINARLFVTGAEFEWPGFLAYIKRYQQLLTELNHPGLSVETRIIEGERHSGTKAEGYTRGMRYVFAPLAPQSGPSTD